MSDSWYYDDNGGQVGPLSLEELRHELAKFSRRKQVYVWRPGFAQWQLATDVPEVSGHEVVPPPLRRKKIRRLNREIATLGVAITIGIIILWAGKNDDKPPTQVTATGPSLPAPQLEFCSIIEGATSDYRDISRRWNVANDQKNGIVKAQLTAEMTNVYKVRNQAAFKSVQQTRFAFENWTVVIAEISYPDPKSLRFTLHPLCSPITKIHAVVPATPQTLDLLSRKKAGDRLTISGRFVERFGGKSGAIPGDPVSADEFEGSFTESGAMQEQEYSTAITILK